MPQALELSSEERGAYRDDGFFLRSAALNPLLVGQLRDAAERAVEQLQATLSGARHYQIDGNAYAEIQGVLVQYEHQVGRREIRVIEPFAHLDVHFERLLDHPQLVAPMSSLLGSSKISLFTNKLNLKLPGKSSRFRWHQDSVYWRHACRHPERLPNVMLMLDDQNVENGCLRLLRGSHLDGPLRSCDGEGILGSLYVHESEVPGREEVIMDAEAGSLCFFHPDIVHGSQANRSNLPRRALIVTCQPPGHPMFRRPGIRELSYGQA